MTQELFRCPLCGFAFDAETNAACQQCPLTRNCPMICCPACGHVTLDPGRSILGRLAQEAFARGQPSAEEPHG